MFSLWSLPVCESVQRSEIMRRQSKADHMSRRDANRRAAFALSLSAHRPHFAFLYIIPVAHTPHKMPHLAKSTAPLYGFRHTHSFLKGRIRKFHFVSSFFFEKGFTDNETKSSFFFINFSAFASSQLCHKLNIVMTYFGIKKIYFYKYLKEFKNQKLIIERIVIFDFKHR